jgi:hypothetical protein
MMTSLISTKRRKKRGNYQRRAYLSLNKFF